MSGYVEVTGNGSACDGTGSYTVVSTGAVTEIKIDGVLISGAGAYQAGAGLHYVEYRDNTGCVGYDTFMIASVTPMSLSYASSAGDCLSSDLSVDVVITGGTAPYVINGHTSATGVYTLTGISSGHVSISVTSSEGCSSVFEFNLYIGHPVVISDTGIVDSVCSGLAFSYTPETNASGSVFAWRRYSVAGISEPYSEGTGIIDEILTNTIDIPVLVEYEYVVAGIGACSLPDTFFVKVLVYPAFDMTLSHYPPDGSTVILGSPITIVSHTAPYSPVNYRYIVGTGAAQLIYDLDGGDNEYLVYGFSEGEVNTIEVTAVNEYGCEVTGIERFEARYNLPNVITPKSPDGTNLKLLEGYDLQVFNRWGSELYRGTGGWDGTYKGTYVASGSYFYVLRYEQPNGKILHVKHNVFVRY
jgi:hypothetical protein